MAQVPERDTGSRDGEGAGIRGRYRESRRGCGGDPNEIARVVTGMWWVAERDSASRDGDGAGSRARYRESRRGWRGYLSEIVGVTTGMARGPERDSGSDDGDVASIRARLRESRRGWGGYPSETPRVTTDALSFGHRAGAQPSHLKACLRSESLVCSKDEYSTISIASTLSLSHDGRSKSGPNPAITRH
jgi:hypothetical protein